MKDELINALADEGDFYASRCQCESDECSHAYLSVPAGAQRAEYVGPICDACASTHLAPYLLTTGGAS